MGVERAAIISSVTPLCSATAERASTLPPSSSHAVTACASPSPAAPNTLLDSPSSAARGLGALAKKTRLLQHPRRLFLTTPTVVSLERLALDFYERLALFWISIITCCHV